ncbi:OpgC domain-containing protein [Gimesia aquarii]|uniref:OpgC protein n=1 Tax=Gimesia aquarii TaxID=2527964 RepID=A0A517VXT7_9PLAN|nr:OpgC domain-containing protein [Gimesia aquarii]QDT97819.1 OpgC protein [Gimesia aquarii]
MVPSDLTQLEKCYHRDLRIDFFRGLALLMILIDHVESMLGESFISQFTLQGVGSCDAAEVFVFLSGYLYGRVYNRVYLKEGYKACVKKSLYRGIRLYLATLLTLCCCLIVSIPFAIYNNQISQRLFLFPLIQWPLQAFLYFLDLIYAPYGFEILHLYIIFFLFLFPVLFLILKKSSKLAWFLSIGLYVLSQCFSWFTIPVPYSQYSPFYFNLSSWQFLFFIGMVIGMRTHSRRLTLLQNRFLKNIALLIVLSIVYFKFTEQKFLSDEVLTSPYWFIFMRMVKSKQTLGPLRLINILALAYYINSITSAQGNFWKTKLAFPLVLCGQHSLLVYCSGLIFVYATVVLSNMLHLGSEWTLVLHSIGGGCSILVALAANRKTK